MNDNNLEVVKNIYKFFTEKNMKAIDPLMHDDVVWQQMEGFPNGGVHYGKEAILNGVFGKFKNEWNDWKPIINEYLNAGNCIIAIGYYQGVYKETQRNLKAPFAHLYYLEEGKIVKFIQYTDTALIAQAMGLLLEKNMA